MRSSVILSLATLGGLASGYQLPSKLKSLYDKHKVNCDMKTGRMKVQMLSY